MHAFSRAILLLTVLAACDNVSVRRTGALRTNVAGIQPRAATELSDMVAGTDTAESVRVALWVNPEEDSSVGDLDSTDPREVSWAAYRAGKRGSRDRVSALRAALRAWTFRDNEEARVVCRFLLDALVDLGADVPGDELVPHLAKSRLVPSLVLLAKGGWYRDRVLLDLFESDRAERDSDLWLACGNLLAAHRVEGFAAELLREQEFTLEVTVRDDQSDGWNTAVGMGGGAGCGFGRAPWVGFPPFPIYDLSRFPREGSVLFAPGPEPVYYGRKYRDGRPWSVSGTPYLPERAAGKVRLAWLAGLAQMESRLEVHTEFTVQYRDDGQFVQEVANVRTDLASMYGQLIDGLIGRGSLTWMEAASVPMKLHTTVRDERGRRWRRLPEVR